MGGSDDTVHADIEVGGISRILDTFKTVEDASKQATATQVAGAAQVADAEIQAELKKRAVRRAANEAEKQINQAAREEAKREAQRKADAEIGEVQRVVDAHRKAAKEKEKLARYEAEYAKITGVGTGRPLSIRAFDALGKAGMSDMGRAQKAWADFDTVSALAGAGVTVFKSAIDYATTALLQMGGMLISDVLVPQAKLATSATQLANRLDGVSGDQMQGTINGLTGQFSAFKQEDVSKVMETAIDQTHDFSAAQQVATLALKNGEAFKLDPDKLAHIIGVKKQTFASMDPASFASMIDTEMVKSLKGGARLDELGGFAERLDGVLGKINAPTMEAAAANDIAVTGLISAAADKGTPGKAVTGLEALLKDLQKATGKETIDQLHVALPELLASVGGNLGKLGSKSGAGATLGGLELGPLRANSVEFLRKLGVGEAYAQGEKEGPGGGKQAVAELLEKIMAPGAGDSAKVAASFANVEDTPLIAFNKAVEEAKESLYPLAAEILTSLTPVIKDAGPKIAAAIKGIADELDGKDIVDALSGVAKGIAGVAYYVMDATGLGGPKATAAMAKLAGIGFQDGTGPNIGEQYAKDDQRLHPDDYKMTNSIVAGAGRMNAAGMVHNAMATLGTFGTTADVTPEIAGGAAGVQGPPTAEQAKQAATADALSGVATKLDTAALALADAAKKFSDADPQRHQPMSATP